MSGLNRTSAALLIASALVLWGCPTLWAQQDAELSVSPSTPVVPHAIGAATFHNNTPTVIPDLGTINSVVSVVGFPASAAIFDVKVSFHITHTRDADLDVSLVGPGGLTIDLTSDNGGTGDNYGQGCSSEARRTNLDDSVLTLVTSGTAPFTATFRPETPLSAFRGAHPDGLWILRVTDDEGMDTGVLQCWSLSLIPRFDNNTPVVIPDLTTVESSVTLAGIQGAIERVQVSLFLTHTFDTDLDIFLVAPDNSVIELSTDNGGVNNNYGAGCGEGQRVTFETLAATSITSGTAPFVGEFSPEATLFALNGRSGSSVNGTWKLRITDDAAPDTGTLQCWSLTVFPQSFDHNSSIPTSDLGTINPGLSFSTSRFPGRLSDVDISFHIEHPFTDALDVFLRAPDSTLVELTTDNDDSGVDNLGASCNPLSNRTTFDDSAATSITAAPAPFIGVFRPEGSLAVLNGKTAAGTWRLEVTDDDAFGDVGALRCWSLHLTQELPSDLLSTITDTPDLVPRGTNLTYALSVTNQGPGPGIDATWNLTVPANTTFQSLIAPVGWTCVTPAVGGTGVMTCNKGTDMINGEVAGFTLIVKVDSSVPVGTNIFTNLNVAALLDTVPSNNSRSQSSTAIVEPTPTDLDGDTLPDAWETRFGVSATSPSGDAGPLGDEDGDGLTNAEELTAGTHPRGFFQRYFAEGAASAFFDTSIALLNVNPTTPAKTLLRHLRGDGTTVSQFVDIPSLTRATVNPEIVTGANGAEFGTVVESDAEVVADRTMRWDPNGYGSHAERSLAGPETTWYLAEGATHSGFNLFYLIQNANSVAADVTVKYLLPAPAAPVVKNYVVGPNSRFNIWVNLEGSGLGSTDVSAIITSSVPVIVERAMYLNSGGLLFGAGHESAGVTETDVSWFLAEGATGDFFDLFVLIANPNPTSSAITATYLLPNGSTIVKNYIVAANSRFNIWVDLEDPLLASTAVSTTIESTNGVPVIVERSMWWPGTSATWFEAHNSAGSTVTGDLWGLAEGEQGGAAGYETYILIANTSVTPGSARVTLFFEDSTFVTRTFPLAAKSRFNVAVGIDFPEAIGRRFGASVLSTGSPAAEIVVERAVYNNAFGIVWAAGSNALGTPLLP